MASWKKVVVRGDNATEEQLKLTAATVDVVNDSIAFTDNGDSDFIKRDTVANFTSAIAGTNISASSGQLSVGTATSSDLGVVKLGSDTEQTVAAEAVSSTSGRTYAVQLNSSDQAVVNVPWSADAASTVTVSDADGTDSPHYLVMTTATSGNANMKVDSSTLQYNPNSDTLTVGNLTVSGDTTTVNTTNLEVTDRFISLNNGASLAADSGIVIDGGGIVFGWDNSAGQFGVQYSGGDASLPTGGFTSPTGYLSISSSNTAIPTDATNGADTDLEDLGNIYVNTTNEDIYIYS